MTATEFTQNYGRHQVPFVLCLPAAESGNRRMKSPRQKIILTGHGSVHAYLHCVEGDRANANYWYRRAGRPLQTGDLRAKWKTIVTELLQQPS